MPADPKSQEQVASEALREAHALCLVDGERGFEQTCDMPDGLATIACDGLHAAIDRAVKAAKWSQHVDDCGQCMVNDYPCNVGKNLRAKVEGDGE